MGFKEVIAESTHAKITFDEPMKKHTAYGVGGPAKYFAQIDSLYSLNKTVSLCKEYRVRYKVIGNGTNILVSDKGFNGMIITIKNLSDVFFKVNEVCAMCGASLEKLIRFATLNGLSGLEALAGIPATVGGAVVMNAGAFGHNISDKITTVETLCDGKIKKYSVDECKFKYRSSRFKGKREVVVSATFKLDHSAREIVSASVQTHLELRKNIHPTGKSCGSVFINPNKVAAGRLIDMAGLKGFSVGGAKVSQKHGNFIITDSKATACDVFVLISTIKEKIKQKFNVDLQEEVEYVGEF